MKKKVVKLQGLLYVLLVILLISSSLLIFNAVYQGVLPKIVEEINNASIGAILTAIITVFLLSQQTNSEEIKERNAKIFEKRLQVYEDFTNELKTILMDKEISTEIDNGKVDEIQLLIFQLANIRMHTSAENLTEIFNEVLKLIENIANFSKDNIQEDDKNIEYYNLLSSSLFNIVEIFHKELYLPPPIDLGNSKIKFDTIMGKIVNQTIEVSERQKFNKYNYSTWDNYKQYLSSDKKLSKSIIDLTKYLYDSCLSIFGSDLEIRFAPTMMSFRKKSAIGRKKVIVYCQPSRNEWSIMKNGLTEYPKNIKSEISDQIVLNITKEIIDSKDVKDFMKLSFDSLI